VRRFVTLLALASALSLLGACDVIKDWFGPEPKVPLKGERIPVILGEQALKADPDIQDLGVTLPSEPSSADWPQSGGNPAHNMQNLSLAGTLNRAWHTSIGSGKSADWKHLATPIASGGRIYTMDTDSVVSALNADAGTRVWRTDIKPEEDVGDGDVGGGLAFADGHVYATNNYGEVLALDADSGAILWRRALAGPTRAAPTAAGGRVFVVTADNQLHALSAKDGTVQWTHAGLAEVTGILGAASPAYSDGILVVPYTSGELYALRAENGRVLWFDTLAAVRPSDSVSALADIRGNPVIDRDRVIAVGHSGRMVAIDLRTGGRVWLDPIGGLDMPWVAGDFVYVLATDNQLACLVRADGRIRWITQLDRWEKPEKKRDPILWVGPVLAGGRLIIGGTDGRLLALAPADGTIAEAVDAGDPISVPPIVSNGTLYVLTDAGDLQAYR
jgi:outer membrane protein assembly factor BamB